MERQASLLEWATNLVPVVCALYLVKDNVGPFSFVAYSVLVGFGATLLVVFLQRILLRDPLQLAAAQEIRPALGRVSWMVLALVLLVAGVNRFCTAIYADGIPMLSSKTTTKCFGDAGFSQMDLGTLAFGVALVVFNVLIPKTVVDASVRAKKKLVFVVENVWVPALVVVTLIGVKLADDNLRAAVPLHAENKEAIAKSDYACNKVAALAKEKADDENKVALAKVGKTLPTTSAHFDKSMLAVALVGLGFFFYGYFQEHRTLIELWNIFLRRRSKTAPSTQEALRRKSLRMLVLNLVVLPPMIVGVAVARNDLGWADVVIYGAFIYSGFGVWGLASQIVRESSNPFSGVVVLFFQFTFGFLVTTLWAAVLIYIKLQLSQQGPFETALTIALGAILIQVVFGPVFTTVWENTLSDKWLQQSSKYAILAMILSAVIAGVPQIDEKAYLTAIFAIVALLVPRLLMRRNLAAYVLIRVRPGCTTSVLQQLYAGDITATVLYGEYDLIAKVEVPGAAAGWPLRRKKPLDDGKELAELALTINEKIRPIEGVVETQALLDFTRFVPAT